MSVIDNYINAHTGATFEKLKLMKDLLKEEIGECEEKLSYGMPTFYKGKNIVHFAAFKTHIGLYPLPGALLAFKEELKSYKSGKGSVQFPLDQDLPIDLIKKIIIFRLGEL